MIKAAAQKGWIDEAQIVCETAVAAYRAGAQSYLTYFAKELAQCMKLAVQGCDDLVLRAAHLPQSLQTSGDSRAALPFNDAVARFEQELLIDALQHAHGNMLQAARDLQVSYRIVNYKVKKYNIDPRSFA